MIGVVRSIADFTLERFGYVRRERTFVGRVQLQVGQPPHLDIELPSGKKLSGYLVPPLGESLTGDDHG
ncbi:hypothetical protein BJD66_gp55 [Gordonia phage Emalyn]|uniref:Uncharacterized protein n=1 Tax=Gordonia phage Emalyn TaxID=1821552 RepID=A0A142KBZ1_9CAUD|nr:hypothetical protein BJD66_gp55 [Gordonia phage Emalyn]AMS03624.1 hypothetical protein SEA_EMALYN_55 [Gordonia phage Emalyn]QXN73625.1 hypothetical protein SEA_AIKOCARSON_57 [Gordonia phage AikoCarson]